MTVESPPRLNNRGRTASDESIQRQAVKTVCIDTIVNDVKFFLHKYEHGESHRRNSAGIGVPLPRPRLLVSQWRCCAGTLERLSMAAEKPRHEAGATGRTSLPKPGVARRRFAPP